MTYNASLHNSLPVVGREDPQYKAYLINIEDQTQRWEFLIPPQVLGYSADNVYQANYGLFGTVPNYRFTQANTGSFSIDNLTFITPGYIRSMRPIMQGLEKLRFPAKGKTQPPRLSLVMGKRILKPLGLQSISFQESELMNGEPTILTVSMTLLCLEQVEL